LNFEDWTILIPETYFLTNENVQKKSTNISHILFQTAAQIFNESDDYAAGAEYMLLVEECMGEVNDRKASDLN
jgi:uncharacterized protein YacL (UPF0231 family)